MSFKNLEKTPEINSIFHDILNLTSKFFDSKLKKIEFCAQKTMSEIEDLKNKIQDLNSDIHTLQPEESESPNKPEKDVNSLNNDITQYFRKWDLEKTMKSPIELSYSPEKTHFRNGSNGNDKSLNPTLKNSSSYKEFQQMMEGVSNGENKKIVNKEKKTKEKSVQKRKEKSEEKSPETPRKIQKGNKKLYEYYVTTSNDRKLNDLISDSHARNNKETANDKKKAEIPRKNTNLRKKEIFQKKLAKNYTVLSIKSNEKLIVTENGELIHSNKTQKLKERENNIKCGREFEEKNELVFRGNERTIKTAGHKRQQTVSCDPFNEKNKMKNASSKLLNYYYFFSDKNKEIPMNEIVE